MALNLRLVASGQKYEIFAVGENDHFAVLEFLNGLSDTESLYHGRLWSAIDWLAKNGPNNPYIFRPLRNQFYEIVINVFRLVYFLTRKDRVIMTHGFVKKTQKTPPIEIRRAESTRSRFLIEDARGTVTITNETE